MIQRFSTITNLINRVPQIMNQRGDTTAGVLSYSLSHLNNVIMEAEGMLYPLIQPYYNLEGSMVDAWASNPESIVEEFRETTSKVEEDLANWYQQRSIEPEGSGELLTSHIQLDKKASTQFVYLKFLKTDGLRQVRAISDTYGFLGDFDYGNEDVDAMGKAGFLIEKEGFEGLFKENNILSFSVYRYSPEIVSLFSLQAAIVFLEKTFTNDMPESPATASDYQNQLNQALNQIRFGRAHLRAAPNRLDTTPISLPYEIDETGTDVSKRNTDY